MLAFCIQPTEFILLKLTAVCPRLVVCVKGRRKWCYLVPVLLVLKPSVNFLSKLVLFYYFISFFFGLLHLKVLFSFKAQAQADCIFLLLYLFFFTVSLRFVAHDVFCPFRKAFCCDNHQRYYLSWCRLVNKSWKPLSVICGNSSSPPLCCGAAATCRWRCSNIRTDGIMFCMSWWWCRGGGISWFLW